MSALAAPVAVVAAVAAFAAGAKLLDPSPTTAALRGVGAPAGDRIVRGGALLELVIAVTVLVSDATVARAALALSYTAFAIFVVVALRRDRPLATCGCVGRADTPPSRVHVVLDALAAAAIAVAAVTGSDAPLRVVASSSAAEGLVFGVLVATGAGLFLASITILPALLTLRAPTR